jgi:hypothetical protein
MTKILVIAQIKLYMTHICMQHDIIANLVKFWMKLMVNIYGVIHWLDNLCIATMVVVSDYFVMIL